MSASEGMPSLARAREAGLEAKTRSFFGRETNLLTREPDENVMIDRAVECFAIPVCMLRFGKVDVALVSTAASAMCVLVEDEPT